MRAYVLNFGEELKYLGIDLDDHLAFVKSTLQAAVEQLDMIPQPNRA